MRRALALTICVLPLAACGGTGSKSNATSPTAPLAEAATKSASASTVKMALDMTMTSSAFPKPISMTATGVEDNTKHRADMTLDMSSISAAFGTSVPKQLADSSLWKGEEITDFSGRNFVLYMRLPFLTRLIPGHKPWIKLDLAAYGKKMGLDFSQLTQFSSDPGQTLDWLRATNGAVTDAGNQVVDGVKTTHYKAAIDLSRYPDLVPASRRAAVRKAINAVVNLTGLRTFPVDVWVSDDGLVRKMNMSFTEDVSGQQMTMNMSTRFHDFNAPVSISLPPASQTLDSSQFIGASGP